MKKYNLFLLIAFLVFLPCIALSQTNVNHSPVITTNPSNEIVAGNTFDYQVQAQDEDNDTLVYTIVTAPENMTINENTGKITWIPTKCGLYNIVLQVSDNKGGYDVQAFQITVIPSAPNSLTCSPNERPDIIALGSTKQFEVLAYDKYQNEISNPKVIWSTDEKIGVIDQNGLFTAKKGGIGFVAAEYDGIKVSIGVVVKGVIASSSTEKSATSETKKTTAAPVAKPKVLGEATQKNTNISTTELKTNVNQPEEKATEEKKEEKKTTCTNWKNWIIVLILVIYSIILIIYYIAIKNKRTNWWWIAPIFLTAIGLFIYFKYFCRGTYVWWPWVMVGLGLIITLYYRRRPYNGTNPEQNQLPF